MPRTSFSPTFLIAAAVWMSGCPTGVPDRPKLPDITDNPDDTGVTTVLPGGSFSLSVPPAISYPMRMAKTGTLDEPCLANSNGQPSADVLECTIDVNELDVAVVGLEFDLTAGSGACEHVRYAHYMYEAWRTGVGPTQVRVDFDDVGNIINEVNAVNGIPYCEFDYTGGFNAPNCCLGSYALTVTVDGVQQGLQFGDWGGELTLADCYDGAAYVDPEATFNALGFPTPKIEYIQGQSWQKHFALGSIVGDYFSNLPFANYYSPAEHGGTRPAGLAAPYAREKYEFECLDHADEQLARIELTVIDWNEQAEFNAYGDPNTVGFEISGDEIDDRWDWAAATPGDDTWIYFLQ